MYLIFSTKEDVGEANSMISNNMGLPKIGKIAKLASLD